MVEIAARSFVKIVWPGESHVVLQKRHPDRPAARFNRMGQDALYLSPDELSARVAIGQYITHEHRERELLTLRLSACRLFDLRAPENAEIYELARQPWIPSLEAGKDPHSWQAADHIRDLGYDGLIDPSRRRPGLWHITLFRWNEKDAPEVSLDGDPKRIWLELDFR